MAMARPASIRPGAWEMVLAFVVGACWFALSLVLFVEMLPKSIVLVVVVVCLDVVVVVAVAHFWDIPYAVTVGVGSVVVLDWFYIPPIHDTAAPDARNTLALGSYLLMASLLGELAVRARRRAVLVEQARSALADEQAALRRVATLVARETPAEQIFSTVTEEVGRLLPADLATMVRYEPGGTGRVEACWASTGALLPVGGQLVLAGDNVAAAVLQTSRAARMDSFDEATGSLAAQLRELGVRSSSGAPIVVAGSLWGVMVAASRSSEPLAVGTEDRLREFTDLVATAVANAQSRTELTASRMRIVTAADEARRHIERDLHDGVQQRLVSLALGLRMAREGDGVTPDGSARLATIQDGLIEAVDELRELSHGIHPATLSEGGLRPALAALSRRSAVPVELEIRDVDRLSTPLEIGLYYVTSEALTNVAKHANASVVSVVVERLDADVRLRVQDDGVGGAGVEGGTGLLGLADRVHALGGRIEVISPAGRGTTLVATIPLDPVPQ